jgi:hypothetical protein
MLLVYRPPHPQLPHALCPYLDVRPKMGNIATSKLSYHLKELREAGLVEERELGLIALEEPQQTSEEQEVPLLQDQTQVTEAIISPMEEGVVCVSEPAISSMASINSSKEGLTPETQASNRPSFSFPPDQRARYAVSPNVLLVLMLTLIGLLCLSLVGGVLLAGRGNSPSISLISSSSSTPSPTTLLQEKDPAKMLQDALERPLLYHDALNDPNAPSTQEKHWTSIKNTCFFSSDGYHVRGHRPFCHETGAAYGNITITVEMVMTAGYSGGLLLRDQDLSNHNGAYFFEVSTDGRYHITNTAMYGTIHDWTPSSALHRGYSTTNTLQVIASGKLFFFYLNGIYMTSMRDSWYESGGISLVCFAQSGSCEATFRNLNVYLSS